MVFFVFFYDRLICDRMEVLRMLSSDRNKKARKGGPPRRRWVLHYYVQHGRNTRKLVHFYLPDLTTSGVGTRRRATLQVLLSQAKRQGVRLRLVDLCLLVSSSMATIKRDLKELRQEPPDGIWDS